MEILEALIDSEKDLVKEFLLKNDLYYEETIDKTLYLKENDSIIGTISKENNIIKCFAIDQNYRGENIANTLISAMINLLYQENTNHVMVYTKRLYQDLFISFGFSLIINTDIISILEYGITNINKEIESIRKNIENKFDINIFDYNINSIVINANPITNGHMHLIEEALKTCDYLVVFLLEEDKSYYSFKERMTLSYISTLYLQNVIVLPSTKYIISNLTFPSYFLKEDNIRNKEWMTTDAFIFKKYFMKLLNIKYRYVGEENNGVMKLYNNTLKEVLGDNLKVIPRLDNISASEVRKLVSAGKIDEAIRYIPHQTEQMFRLVSMGKVNGK